MHTELIVHAVDPSPVCPAPGSNPGIHVRNSGRRGFTLTELIVGIGIVGILIAIAMPAMQTVRQMARKAHCSSNIRQLSIAMMAYESNGTGLPAADNGKGMSFVVALLPHLDEEKYAARAKDTFVPGESINDRLIELSDQRITVLLCPAAQTGEDEATIVEQGSYTSHYPGICGPIGTAHNSDQTETYYYDELTPRPTQGPISLQGVFAPGRAGKFNPQRLKDIKDGTSNTFAFGENSHEFKADQFLTRSKSGWAFGAGYGPSSQVTHTYGVKSIRKGINSPYDSLNDLPFGSNHPGGTHFACVDGSVHFVHELIAIDILKTFSSINQKEDVESFDEY